MNNTARQTTDTILMVRPAHFGFNEETAANNAFQKQDERMTAEQVQEQARQEFDRFVAVLRDAGVRVIVIEDRDEPVTPDSVFPNNWVTFHQDGTIVTYPMFAGMRRLERREDVLTQLSAEFGFGKRVHLEENEAKKRFLEGTGSMILDREHGIAYACLSPRTHAGLFDEYCRRLGFEPVSFTALDGQGQEIYHTNVMMALGETFVVICLDTVRDAGERQRLLEHFAVTGKEVIPISLDQMMAFAGNMLQVRNVSGQTFLVMSEQAYRSLRPEQVRRIGNHTRILYSSLDTIETFGGGSARCMMAEVFRPE